MVLEFLIREATIKVIIHLSHELVDLTFADGEAKHL
jgi:hypothetical protein